MTVRRVLGILITGLIVLGVTQIAAAGGEDGDFEDIRQVLNTIPTGRAALAMMELSGVNVEIKAGGGTYYRAASNSIVIDAKHSPIRAALSFVHEIHHAQTWHLGQRADIELSAEEYIRLRVKEEAQGVVKSIEARMELAATGLDASSLRYPLEKNYVAAYEAAIETGQVTEEAARRAGYEAVVSGFMSGAVRGSQNGQTYPEYFNGCWEKAQMAGKLLGSVSETLMNTATQMVAESC